MKHQSLHIVSLLRCFWTKILASTRKEERYEKLGVILHVLYHLNHFECHMSQRVHSYSQNDHVSHVSRASFGKVECHKVKKVPNLTKNSPKLKIFLRYDGFSSFLARCWVFHALNIRVKCTLIGILFGFCTNVTVTGPVFDHSARYKYVPCHRPFEVIQMVQ